MAPLVSISSAHTTLLYVTRSSNGPELNIARLGLAAGIVTDDITNEKLVIVVGGYSGDKFVRSIEIRQLKLASTSTDICTRTWKRFSFVQLINLSCCPMLLLSIYHS